MKLKNDFFRVTECCQTTKGIDFTIEFNEKHQFSKLSMLLLNFERKHLNQ
jgi:hypothetical protein